MIHYILAGLLFFLAGCSDGFRDACIFHWDAVRTKLKLKTDYFNYLISYLWKYKNRDASKGQTFVGRYFTFLVDGIHLLKTIQNLCIFSGLVICLSLFHDFTKWWQFVCVGLGAWGCRGVGFNIVYSRFNLFK